MHENTKCTLLMPPFPTLTWEKYSWKGKVVLTSWKGFQSRGGPYGAVSSKKGSDGSARLTVDPREVGSIPTPEQNAAYEYLMDHQKAIRDVLLKAIFKAYPDMRDSFGFWGETEEEEEEIRDKLMPEIDRPDHLKRLIGLSNVHVHHVAKSGVAYVGFEFGCTWDDEHGLGVMMHKKRVAEVGQADTSILEWIAEQDAKPQKKPPKKH